MLTSSDTPGWSLRRRPRLEVALFVVILALSVAPKIADLLGRGALSGDEAALAMNIGPRAFVELGRPFVYLQVAPWGAMAGIKVMTLLLGETELGYRAFPFLGAVAAVLAAYTIGRRIHSPLAGLAAMLLTGTTYGLTHYAAEIKPYAVDAAVAGGITLAGAHVLADPQRYRRWGVMLAVGLIGAGTSLPSLFVLGSCGSALALDAWLARRGAKHLAVVVGTNVLWLGAFFGHYQTFIARSTLVSSAQAAKHWSEGFAPFPPTSWAELRWYPGKFFSFFDSPGGLSIPYLAGAIFILGIYALMKRKLHLQAILLFGPTVLAICASALGKYPSAGRLMLFAVPAMMVVVAVGFTELMRQPRRHVRVIAAAVLLLLVAPGWGRTYAPITGPARVDMRHVMAKIAEQRQEGDAVFMAGGGLATIWDFYGPGLGLPKLYSGVDGLRNFDDAGNYPALRDLAEKCFGHPRLWLVAATLDFPIDEQRLQRSSEAEHAFITRFLAAHGATGDIVLRADDLNLYLYDTSTSSVPPGVGSLPNPR